MLGYKLKESDSFLRWFYRCLKGPFTAQIFFSRELRNIKLLNPR